MPIHYSSHTSLSSLPSMLYIYIPFRWLRLEKSKQLLSLRNNAFDLQLELSLLIETEQYDNDVYKTEWNSGHVAEAR